MQTKPLSGWLWRVSVGIVFILLLIAIVHTFSMLAQPITIG